jgi:hypothetical protein
MEDAPVGFCSVRELFIVKRKLMKKIKVGVLKNQFSKPICPCRVIAASIVPNM